MAVFPETPKTLLAKIAVQVTGQADEFAWVRFFELYEPAIVKFAQGQGAASDAEDVAQEILMKVVDFLRAGKYSEEAGKFRCFLATLIRREVISYWRKAQARGAAVSVSMNDDTAGIDPGVPSETQVLLDAKWRLARHEAAVERVLTRTAISKQMKDIYRAYVVEEGAVAEVAKRFGVSADTVYQVKTRVGRLVDAIEQEMGD